MNLVIRKYSTSDIQLITEIFNEVVNEGNSFLTEKPVTADYMSTRIKNHESAVYVAQSDGEICGCYMIRPNLKGRGNHISNATYFVSSKYRGRGIGFKLGLHSIETARNLGFKGLQFNSVVESNEASLSLWNKLNFRKIGLIPNGFQLTK